MEVFIVVIVLLFSVVLHEVSHGLVAQSLGDSTAKEQGRLTLNPIPHLDPIGSVILPAFLVLSGSGMLFGWAKPVPVNPANFSDKKYGDLKVSFAGPASNLALAVIFGLLLRFFFFPLYQFGVVEIFSYIVFLNIVLAFFNLIPLPPLDGSHILFSLLPDSMRGVKIFLYQYSLPLIFMVIFFFPQLIGRVADFIFSLIVGKPI